ncbi:hypothetical protein ACFP63_19400 [Oerskovia jenensis]|uniref:Uncharacterized protein n=1 Tax=Oerskovia jenensis TaxID=162169 RepID=A0ABS2LAA0_9CELL|nr:hypothetical protein [Oerskovia jenensis]MBM7477124.1 hypothetical protein [Oerskovia jenensis]
MAVVAGTDVWATGVLVASRGRHGLLLEHATRGLDQVPPTLDAPWVVALTGSRPARDALGTVVEVVGVWTGDEILVAHVTVLDRHRDRTTQDEAGAVGEPADPAGTPATAPAAAAPAGAASMAAPPPARSMIGRPPPQLTAGTRDILGALDTLGLVVALQTGPGTETCAEEESASGVTVRVTVADVDAAVRIVRHAGVHGRGTQDRIVLVPSRWSAVEVAAARCLHEQVPEGLLVAFGESVTEDDQLEVLLTVTYVTPALEALVARLPGGIVDVTALVQERSSAAHRV